MANWNGLQLTNKGIALQAKVQAGTQLHITKLKLGSGVVPSGTDIKTLTDLITPEQNLGIGGKEAIDDYCKISSTISNTELETGYYVRELGVFAQDPDEGEILYLYTTDGAPDYLPAGGGSTVISQEFSVMIAVDDTDNILVDIDPAALATMGYVQLQIQEHNTDTTAHADFTGATAEAAGKRGMVPAPAAGDQNKALFGDATYKQVVQKVNGVVADSAGNVLVNSLAQTDIPENADLNNYTESGFYRCMYSATVATISNKPETTGVFYMQVVRGGTTTQRYQILYNTSSNTLWTRSNVSGTSWTDWVKLVKATDVIPIANGGTGATTVADARNNLGITQTNGYQIPTGTILPFAGGTIPSGFLACNGAAVSRTTYSALFSAIGTTYGTGNGSSTFNVPQVEDNSYLEFSSTRGTKNNAGLPNITGEFDVRRGYNQYGEDDGTLQGAFVFGSSNNAFTGVSTQTNNAQNVDYGTNVVGTTRVTFSAANANSIYGASTTVQPKSLTVRAIIKY